MGKRWQLSQPQKNADSVNYELHKVTLWAVRTRNEHWPQRWIGREECEEHLECERWMGSVRARKGLRW